jgi:protein arginine N-methyltransferase 5
VVDAKPAEQPYVVMFSAYHFLSAPGGRLNSERIQECWSFEHPRPDVVVDHQGKSRFSRSTVWLNIAGTWV